MKNKKFTKGDLKVGYIVKAGDCLYMVMVTSDGAMALVDGDEGWMDLGSYSEELNYLGVNVPAYTITEIYGHSKYAYASCTISTNERTLLWKREEPAKKMTVAEIEKELGYKIEIVS